MDENIDRLCAAIYKDIRKCKTEAFCYEIAFVLNDAKDALRFLDTWAKPKKVSRNLLQAIDKAYIVKQPLGTVLIIGPWNYPIQLLLCPLVGALAAGNCVVIKPSEFAPATADLLAELVEQYFDPDVVTVVKGGIDETQELLKERFDHIFFTGSTAVGKIIMSAAAQNLTPVTLELGGKCPVIIDKDCDIPLSARRIAWGKLIACGQTCIAPDYVFIHEQVKNEFIEELKKSIEQLYGPNPQLSHDYCRIVSDKHFDRLTQVLHSGRIVYGGKLDRNDLYISPTILDDVIPSDPAMFEEIFGPILPILTYSNVEEALEYVNDHEKPLAVYIFSTNTDFIQETLNRTYSGGVTVNDVIMHLALDTLPFGGVGHSGMGRYHGKYSFDCFTHERSVLHRPQCGEKVIWMRYPPYTASKLKWAQRVLARHHFIPLSILYFVPLCLFGFLLAFVFKKYF